MGDDWEVQCNDRADFGPIKKLGESITGKDLFHLQHVDTGCLLNTDPTFRFTHQNCPRCIIVGHMEVACHSSVKQKTNLWKVDSGFFFPSRGDDQDNNSSIDDDEWMNKEL